MRRPPRSAAGAMVSIGGWWAGTAGRLRIAVSGVKRIGPAYRRKHAVLNAGTWVAKYLSGLAVCFPATSIVSVGPALSSAMSLGSSAADTSILTVPSISLATVWPV